MFSKDSEPGPKFCLSRPSPSSLGRAGQCRCRQMGGGHRCEPAEETPSALGAISGLAWGCSGLRTNLATLRTLAHACVRVLIRSVRVRVRGVIAALVKARRACVLATHSPCGCAQPLAVPLHRKPLASFRYCLGPTQGQNFAFLLPGYC